MASAGENIYDFAAAAAAQIGPAVVQITPAQWSKKGPGPRALGSGVVVDADGYLLTNAHVVDKEPKPTVTLVDGHRATAEIVGVDTRLNLAVLHLPERSNLPTAAIGDSEMLRVGELVLAVSNPFGLDWMVTCGVVSALEHAIVTNNRTMDGLIQTDAIINVGHSGGPLVSSAGRVVGITTAAPTAKQRLGFAIPINLALRVYRELREQGWTRHPWLGVEGRTERIDAKWVKMFELPFAEGALITRVAPDSPAERAGLQVFDLIVQCNDREVAAIGSLRRAVEELSVGSTAYLHLMRGGTEMSLEVEVEEIPEHSGRD